MAPAFAFGSIFCAACLAGAEAEDQQGLSLAKEELGQLLPLKIADGRLLLDEGAWQQQEQKAGGQKEEEEAGVGAAAGIGLGGGQFRIRHMVGQNLSWPAKLFERVFNKVAGAFTGGGSSQSGSRVELRRDSAQLSGRLAYDKAQGEFAVRFVEKGGDQRLLSFEQDQPTGLTVRLSDPAAGSSVLLVQGPQGPVALVQILGKECVSASAENFAALLRREPNLVQGAFFRPLGKLGIAPPLNRHLPPVMAAATSGCAPPAAEVKARIDALMPRLGAEDMETREKATQELIELFPLAAQYVTDAAAHAEDPEVRMRLNRAVAAHPTIAKARAYVEENKLHQDRAYLLDILANVPFLRPAARARLAVLYGKDYGDDPQSWPRPEGEKKP
jgi:hypothetical protein